MRIILAMAPIALLAACEPMSFISRLPQQPEIAAPQPAPSARRYTTGNGDVPAFHAALARCGSISAGQDRRLRERAEMQAAQSAANGGSGQIRVEIDDPLAGARERAVEQCMSARGYRAAR